MTGAEKQFLIDDTTKKVLTWGFYDMTALGHYDSQVHHIIIVCTCGSCSYPVDTHTIITGHVDLNPDLEDQDWWWHSATSEFKTTAP